MNDDLHERLARALGAGYALEGELGHGGFAMVFAARDRQLDRDVAVKVLRPELAGMPDLRTRFRREAEAAARLRHPHLLPIYSVGEDDELVYFVMPRVQGESLKARLARERRLAIDVARRILIEAAGALGVAHRAGLVHRDVKPDNIMLETEEARVLLMDFGIAKVVGRNSGLTQTGSVVGTPHYMSPEQASGDHTIDHRSDLYSLGVVGFEMLTGAVPFDADSTAAILVKHVTAEAPSVSRARPECPPDLAAAITRCLLKDPAERWNSAGDLVRALQGESRRSTRGTRVSGTARLADPVRRYRLWGAGVLTAVLGGAVVDLVLHQILWAPLAVVSGVVVLAVRYVSLWQAGFEWRDVLRGRRTATPASDSLDSAELGEHLAGIQAARQDRVAIRMALARLPRVQRDRLALVNPAVDDLVALATELARQLRVLERQLDPGIDTLEARIQATRAEPDAPGRTQRLVVLEGRREALLGTEVRRQEVSDRLAAVLADLSRVRLEVERGRGEGLADVEAAINAALDSAAVDVDARSH